MTAEEFEAWLKAMRWRGADAARHLGVDQQTVSDYRRKGGKAWLRLACLALFAQLHKFKGPWE
jgi:hypothetical protein